jgi:hypothetical protein
MALSQQPPIVIVPGVLDQSAAGRRVFVLVGEPYIGCARSPVDRLWIVRSEIKVNAYIQKFSPINGVRGSSSCLVAQRLGIVQ